MTLTHLGGWVEHAGSHTQTSPWPCGLCTIISYIMIGHRRGRPTKGRDTPHTHTQESGGRPRDEPILWRALRPPLCTTLHRTPNTTLHKTLGATIAPTPGHHPLHEGAHSTAHGRFALACTRLFGHSLCAATVPRLCYTPLCTCTRPRTLRNHCARLSGRFTDLVT